MSIVKVGKDGESTKELPGASMKLTYTGDADLSKVTAENGEISGNTEGSKEITWTSGDKAIKLNQIPDGKYTLEETVAPDGYDLTTEITFDVVNGKVENVQVGENNKNGYNETQNLITVFDDLKPGVTISKQAVGGGEELTGATLKLTGTNGEDLSKVTGSYGGGSTEGIKNDGNSISWTSDNAKGSVTLSKLPAGTLQAGGDHLSGRLHPEDRGDDVHR
ncbi:MAG: SpaA isopeptide-forming pilin-related protein [Ruminococcus sp.]